ncbi:MAG: beta strand repeat-containing protein, partial [Janthinobacterium lividum]
VNATASASLIGSQHFELPLSTPTTTFPNGVADLLPTICSGGSECVGSGGLLSLIRPASSNAATDLSISAGDLPNLRLHNAGPVAATGLGVTASGFEVSTDCGSTLVAFAECGLALNGTGPGSITISASNAPSITMAVPVQSVTPQMLVFSPSGLDFGIVTSNSNVSRTLTISNLSSTVQNFSSSADGGPTKPPYALAESGSTCGGTAGAHTLAADSSCTITFGLTASSNPANDGPVSAFWKLGARDLAITGITQAAALSVSAAEIDFGVRFPGTSTAPLPRYLYLSNSSDIAVEHAPITLPANSPFTVEDACPSTLEAGSVCQIILTYTQSAAPTEDSATLLLDQGLSVLVTGEVLASPTSSAVNNAGLSLSTDSLSFTTPVVVTGISAATQVVRVTNQGTTAFPLTVSATLDFLVNAPCGTVLNPGASCDLAVQFAPSQPGVREGLLSLATGSNYTPLLVHLSGTGTDLLPSNNGTLSLGQTFVGEPIVSWYKVQAAVGYLSTSVAGSTFGVAIVEDKGAGHGTLPANAFTPAIAGSCANCWLGIQFYPQSAGPATSTLTLSTVTGGNAEQLALTASSLPVQGLVLTPATPEFGTVPLGSSSAPMVFTLANLLSPAATTSIVNVSATGDFTIGKNTTGGASCQDSLASTASCYVEVSFTPTALGKRAGTLTVQTTGGTAVVSLLGSGAASAALGLNPNSLVFSNQPGSAATQQSITLTNTGSSSLTIGTITAPSPSFGVASGCATLAPGATCTIAVTFTPGVAEVVSSLVIPVSVTVNGQTSSTTYVVPLSATYTESNTGLLLLPSQADFGAQATADLGLTRQFTLTNTSVATQAIALTVPAQFPLAAPFNCATLTAGATCTFSVSFLPETGGALTGSLVATGITTGSSVSGQAIGYLLGYGMASGSLTIAGQPTPGAPLNFGQLISGQTAQQTLTLSNTGTGPMTVRRVSSAPPFRSSTTCGEILAPGDSCAVLVTYSPVFSSSTTASSLLPRADTGALVIESDAASSPDSISLMGSAVSAGTGGTAGDSSSATYTISEGALTFANTQVGDSSAAQMLTLVNTGTQPLVLGSVNAPQDFSATTACTTLAPGAACSINVAFTPGSGSAIAVRAGTLEIPSNAANPLEFVSLLGMSSAAPLSLSPTSLNFGTVDMPSSDQLSVTVTNTASLPITFGQSTASGDYAVETGTCPSPGSSLPAGQSCAFIVTFTPSATGTRTGLLSITTNATQLPLTVGLTGLGIEAKLQISPGALAFGSISVGASASLALELNNAGSGDLSGITTTIIGPNAADFAVTTPCAAATLPPGIGCSVQVSFTPSANGARVATLVLTSSDPSSPTLIALSGTGIQPGSFLLTVGGQSTASVTVAAGMPATYSLMLTPQYGFAGMAALTCTPVSAAPYAGCALLSSQLNLSSGAQGSTVTITTVNGAVTRSASIPFGMLLLVPSTWLLRNRRRSGLRDLCGVIMLIGGVVTCTSLAGCGGPGNSGLNLTPAGTYKYQVTANSISGTAISSTVTLELVVQ